MRSLPLLTVSASVVALTVSTSAFAQQSAPAPTNNSPVEPTSVTPPSDSGQPVQTSTTLAANNPDTSSGSTIVVTGSRIRRPDFSTPNPVVSLGAAQIQESGTTNLTQFLSGYPALQGSSGSSANSGDQAGIGYTGLNLLDLRNLGTDRTLVLVDGRRHVSGVPGSQAVDINTIPTDLVDRVDILTGGASAIYGADGVSGVVNFVLKKNFQGLTARAQAGISGHGDAGQRLLAVTAGHNFAGGRGNVAIAFEHGAEDRLETRDRSYLRGTNSSRFVLNPDDPENQPGYTGPADNGIPDYVPLKDIRYSQSTRGGAIITDFDTYLPSYIGLPGGAVGPYVYGRDIPGGYEQGGSATLTSDYGNDLLPRIRRNVVNVLGHFDVSPALTIFAEGKYARNKSFSLSQPTFDYYLYLAPDNPYLPANLLAAAPDGVLVNRDNFDFGQRGEDILRQTYRGVVGAKGDLGGHANYEVSYTYGRTDVRNHYINDRITDRFNAALDAVVGPNGQVTCRVNIDPTAADATTFKPGECVPINIIGEGSPSQAALDFISADTIDKSRITQQVLSGSIAGDLGAAFTFPGGGALGYAVGAEYRKETSRFRADPLASQGLTFGNALSNDHGSYNVKEAFAEVRAPLLKDRPGAYRLELGAAGRISDYSTIGTTKSWKVDGSYAPVRDITFTGTYSTAVRAPNIGELFSGGSQTFEFFDDPCNSNNVGAGTSYRAANCSALLTSLGVTDPSSYLDTRTVNISGTSGGNRNLKAEKAKTWTAGVIVQPSLIPGLTARVDYYHINLTNAINTVAPQQLAELCVDQPSLDNAFCNAIVRQNGNTATTDAGNIIGFTVGPQNVAAFKTAGVDLNLNYRKRTRVGTFTLNVIANALAKLEFVGTPGADPTNSRGEPYAPKHTVHTDLTWNRGKLTLNYALLYFSKTTRFSNLRTSTNPDVTAPEYKYLKEHWEHNIYANYDLNNRFSVYGGVNNVFNQKPDLGTSRYPVNAVGRFFFGGLRVKLDKFL
jgi:outer membrane receptor protein involved in Fe transport